MKLTFDFFGPINEESLHDLNQLLVQHKNKNIEQLSINISSLGGSLVFAVAIYNYLKSLPFKVTTHNLSEVTSAAVLIYLADSERTAECASKFTIHPPALSISENCNYYRLNELLQGLYADIKNYAQIVNQETNQLNGIYNVDDILRNKSITLRPDEALKCGIITNVIQ